MFYLIELLRYLYTEDLIMQKISIFPTNIWKFSINDSKRVNAEILEYIQSLKDDPESVFSSKSKSKWHTTRALHKREQLAEVNQFVIDSCRSVLEATKVKNGDSLVITGAWGNISGPGSSHHKHTHPNNYLSCVYYVATDKGCNTINFYDPREQVGLIRPSVSENTIDNTEDISLEVYSGDLVIFPHWLRHNVSTNVSNAERVSIAFNLMLIQCLPRCGS
jgi:uncharacterized protein (TIGR02466 family)